MDPRHKAEGDDLCVALPDEASQTPFFFVVPAPGGFAALHILSRKARRAGTQSIRRLDARLRGHDEGGAPTPSPNLTQ